MNLSAKLDHLSLQFTTFLQETCNKTDQFQLKISKP